MDRYRVSHQVNAGAFGAVFEAFEKKSGERVAVKKVNKKFYEFNQTQRNRELKALKAMPHPNIVSLLDFVEKGGSIYFVFEFMDHNLYEVICNQKGVHFPINFIQSTLKQILLGIEFIHSNGFFHCDLKPENILVNDGKIKIADFGQVQELKKDDKKLIQQVTTRWYRAPEVLLSCYYYSSPIDIWAVGAIAAELMTLSPLFPGKTNSDQVSHLCSVLGSPSDISCGGPWPLGKQLATLAGLRLPDSEPGRLTTILSSFPHHTPESTRFVMELLRYEPGSRLTASEALSHNFFYGEDICGIELPPNCLSTVKTDSLASIKQLSIDLGPDFFILTGNVDNESTDQYSSDAEYSPGTNGPLGRMVSLESTLSNSSNPPTPPDVETVSNVSIKAIHSLPISGNHSCDRIHPIPESFDRFDSVLAERKPSRFDSFHEVILTNLSHEIFEVSSDDTEELSPNVSPNYYDLESRHQHQLDSQNYYYPIKSHSQHQLPSNHYPHPTESHRQHKFNYGLRKKAKIPPSEFRSLHQLPETSKRLVRPRAFSNTMSETTTSNPLFEDIRDIVPPYLHASQSHSSPSMPCEAVPVDSLPTQPTRLRKLSSVSELKALFQKKPSFHYSPARSNVSLSALHPLPASNSSPHHPLPSPGKPPGVFHRPRGSVKIFFSKVTTMLRRNSSVEPKYPEDPNPQQCLA